MLFSFIQVFSCVTFIAIVEIVPLEQYQNDNNRGVYWWFFLTQRIIIMLKSQSYFHVFLRLLLEWFLFSYLVPDLFTY